MLTQRMDYAEARGWLESLGEFHMEFGLDRVRTVLAALGNPERCAPAIHVAGTNGKGMTCAIASAALRYHRVRVGLYTSPHLSRPNERIAIAGTPIDDAGFAAALTAVRSALDSTKIALTYFEAITCAAFVAFRDAAVQAMVIEVGLGGRLDATNVIDPAVCVITSVALDHTAILGATVEEIAAEKAGIVKSGRPVVIPANDPVIRRAVEAKAHGGKIWTCGETGEVGWKVLPGKSPGLRLPGELEPPRGTSFVSSSDTFHEAAAMAGVAVRLFDASLQYDTITLAYQYARWPGRNELAGWVRPGGKYVRQVMLDGGHNPAAAAAVAKQLIHGEGPHVLLFAAMVDKDRLGMLRAHATRSPGAVVCTSAGTARSATARHVAEEARMVFGDTIPIEAVERIEDALDRAAELVSPTAGILVTGSLYLVGRVREIVTGGPPTEIG